VLDKECDLTKFLSIESIKHVNVAVFTDTIGQSLTCSKLQAISESCRERTAIIVADQNGVFSRIVTDLGKKPHLVVDKDGEQLGDVMIADMQPSEAGDTCKVKALMNVNHGF